ncbi:MAG: oligopeptide ABC transporter substrate-binding protein [Lagierella massiliensis]|nr:oligopeptide ABC transporter substrate-binding protein [Lagierella massiliensis]
MKKFARILAVGLALGLTLTACKPSGGSDSTDSGNSGSTDAVSSKKSEITWDAKSQLVENDGEAIEGGTLEYGIVSDSPIKGIFDVSLYTDSNDYVVIGMYQGGNLYGSDDSFRLISSDKVEINYDEEGNKVTFKLNPDLTWNDGTPVTAMDLAYPYYIVGHPDYTGVRYDKSEDERIVGMKEYHEGTTDKIEGITTPDDHTVVVQYTELTPATHWGSGIRVDLSPYHYLKDIPIGELEESDEIRIRPLSAGPYYISNYVQGQKVELSANEHYYKGKPKIEKINMEVVPSSNIVSAMKAHKYDMISSVPSKSVDELMEIPGYKMVGKGDFYYSYLGFALGHYDQDEGTITPDPNKKMANVNLRKALGYALDQNAVAEKFYKGHNQLAKSVILPIFTEFYDDSIEGYVYDPDKAMELLDEAGYKDVDGDGFREDPKGEPLVINLAMMAGGDTQEPLSQYYLQCWEKIGLKSQLATGNLMEFNSFYDKVEAEDPEIDVFAAAWGVGTNPNPKETYGNSAAFNMSRYTSDTLQEPIDRISSAEAADPEFMAQAYKDFQKAVFEECPAIPLQWRTDWVILNNRVKNFDAGYGNGEVLTDPGDWELTSEKPLEK